MTDASQKDQEKVLGEARQALCGTGVLFVIKRESTMYEDTRQSVATPPTS